MMICGDTQGLGAASHETEGLGFKIRVSGTHVAAVGTNTILERFFLNLRKKEKKL